METLLVTLFDGGLCERHTATWDDVRAFMAIAEVGCGYTAILVVNAEGKEVLATRIE